MLLTILSAEAQVTQKAIDSLNIITKVDSFYNSAWSKLVILIGLIGIIVPILIQFYQYKLFEFKENKIKATIKDEITEEITSIINHRFTQIDEKLSKELAYRDGSVYHVQGMSFLNSEVYYQALISFFKAGKKYIEVEAISEFQAITGNIKICLRHLDNSDLQRMENEDGISFHVFFDYIESNNENNFYSLNIREIKSAYRETCAR